MSTSTVLQLIARKLRGRYVDEEWYASSYNTASVAELNGNDRRCQSNSRGISFVWKRITAIERSDLACFFRLKILNFDYEIEKHIAGAILYSLVTFIKDHWPGSKSLPWIVVDRLSRVTLPDFIRLTEKPKKFLIFFYWIKTAFIFFKWRLFGKVYVAEFFFSRCPTICPIMNKHEGVIRSLRPRRFWDRLFYHRPRPRYANHPKICRRLCGQNGLLEFFDRVKEDIYRLANEGFNIFASINPAVAGGFEHQGYFALIDKDGFIRSRRDDLGIPLSIIWV